MSPSKLAGKTRSRSQMRGGLSSTLRVKWGTQDPNRSGDKSSENYRANYGIIDETTRTVLMMSLIASRNSSALGLESDAHEQRSNHIAPKQRLSMSSSLPQSGVATQPDSHTASTPVTKLDEPRLNIKFCCTAARYPSALPAAYSHSLHQQRDYPYPTHQPTRRRAGPPK